MDKFKKIIKRFSLAILTLVVSVNYQAYCNPGDDKPKYSPEVTLEASDVSDEVNSCAGEPEKTEADLSKVDKSGDENAASDEDDKPKNTAEVTLDVSDESNSCAEEREKTEADLSKADKSGDESAASDEDDSDQKLLENLRYVNSVLIDHPGCQRIKGRYAVVGDIHGDIDVFEVLVDQLETDIMFNHIDGVVFLGDFWDRNFGDVEVFKELIKFAARLNKDGEYKVIILLGNHETPSFIVEYGKNFSRYINFLKRKGKNELAKEIINFYCLLPFNAIINSKIYAVHGGLPYIEPIKSGISAITQLVSTERDVYPGISGASEPDLLYLSVWLRFRYDLIDSELKPSRRDEVGTHFFGPKHVESSLRLMNITVPGLDVRTIIRGHDHTSSLDSFGCDYWKGSDGKQYCVCRVITFTDLSAHNLGTVALVMPDFYQPIPYYKVYYDHGMAVVEKYF